MNKRFSLGIAILVVVLVLVVIAGFFFGRPPQVPVLPPSTPPIFATFFCGEGESVSANFLPGVPQSVPPGERPVPTGSVSLVFSDGRSLMLPQTISADGGRYANADESIVFWNKGRGVWLTEQSQTTHCVEVVKDPGGLSEVYGDTAVGFSLRHARAYAVDATYQYQALGPGKEIKGVKFTIPEGSAQGTNLGADSGVSIETISALETCTATPFLPQATAQEVTEGDTTYSVASSTGAGAGNRYEEIVYALPGTSPCVAVRYFVHSSVYENYPEGTIRRFDRDALLSQFDAIRHTLVVAQ